MKKIVRLTESDLARIVERVLNEQFLAQAQAPSPTQNLIGAQGAPKNFQNITPTQKNAASNNQTTYTVRNPELILVGQTKKTGADASEDLKIFKGAKFIKQGGNMVANTKYQFVDALGNVVIGVGNAPTMRNNKTYSGNVTYGCGTGKYTVDKRTDIMFYDKTLSPMLNKMCQAKAAQTQSPKTQQTTTQTPKTQQTTTQQTTTQQTVAPSIENVNAKRAVMRMGMTGDSVKQLQQLLAKHGYFKAQPTNNFGKITDQAVKAFQTAKNLKADGIVGDVTLKLLQGPVASQEQLAKLPTNSLQQMQIQQPQQQLQTPQQQTVVQSGTGEEAVSRRELRQRSRQR
jgi:peptidoglycan hydrolase-like protein with peptidoglycan-binding domain